MQQQAVERVVGKCNHLEESVAAVEKIPQEPISERNCEQSEVIEVTEPASQDRILQRAAEQTLLWTLSKVSLSSKCLNGPVNRSGLS